MENASKCQKEIERSSNQKQMAKRERKQNQSQLQQSNKSNHIHLSNSIPGMRPSNLIPSRLNILQKCRFMIHQHNQKGSNPRPEKRIGIIKNQTNIWNLRGHSTIQSIEPQIQPQKHSMKKWNCINQCKARKGKRITS